MSTNLGKYFYYCSIYQNQSFCAKFLVKYFQFCRIYQNQGFSSQILSKYFQFCRNDQKGCKVHKSCENISSFVGFTKTRAFPTKSGQNCTNLLCRTNVSRALPCFLLIQLRKTTNGNFVDKGGFFQKERFVFQISKSLK